MSELFAYGTLRSDEGERATLPDFRRVKGAAPFPTVEPHVGSVVDGVVLEVDDWDDMDRYEGHDPDDPRGSLYWRLRTRDGTHVYVGNPAVAGRCWGRTWDVDYVYDTMRRALDDAEVLR